jgi:hypothetical protein
VVRERLAQVVGLVVGQDRRRRLQDIVDTARLTIDVTGKRLDGDSAPFRALIPPGYRFTYQASGLYFPAAGCWQVDANGVRSVAALRHQDPVAARRV